MKSIIALTVAAFTLASCGGGGGGALGPTSRDIGILPSGFVATYDDATDEVVLTIDGVEVARMVNTGAFSGFTQYVDGTAIALYAETISGDGAVFVVQSPTVDLSLAGVQVARLGETNLPSSGSATFNGQYASILVDTDQGFQTLIQGDAQLFADFAGASIFGEITNRNAVGLTGDDILLLPTAITSAGAFSGTITGGDLSGILIGNTTAIGGEYVGLIVGDTGNEVVGGLSLALVGAAGLFRETGAFVAAE